MADVHPTWQRRRITLTNSLLEIGNLWGSDCVTPRLCFVCDIGG